ncbi:unnamed protein product [Macrosiphum euphorbiae]|uniref:Uncharacterized protein n=2 Tax=Macrosiphum euphorbiae TaxID=13131 RepID=A0AAV0X3Q8_9HEMI|nr:unnamed protein product [Macrosiphum euphorbiae]
MIDGGEEQPDDGGVGGRDTAVNYKTRKRPADATATAVYTITGGDANQLQDVSPPWSSQCACCPPPVGCAVALQGNGPQRRRPRTWTCGGAAGGGGGAVSSLTRSRTFTSNYERAISSLLWQPYECRSSSNSLNDDGDVAVWLSATGRYEPLSSRSSLSLSTIPRSAGSCSSSVCRLLDDGGDKTPPPPCWCSAETAAVLGDPHNDDIMARTTTGYRCPPHGSLLQRRGTVAAAVAVEGGRPLPRSRLAADVQSNVQRPTSRIVPSRCVSAGDWCCDNGDVDVDDDDDDDDEDYYCVYEDENLRRVDNDVDVRDDNRVRAVVLMDNGSGLITGGEVVGGTADSGKPQERTYASTEAQTDETACSSAYREQRRRERRERRLQQQRRVHPPPPPPPALSSSSLLPPPPPPLLLQQQQQPSIAVSVDPDRLPDLLLNSHLPPPLYTTVGGGVCDVAMATRAANLQASLLPAPFQHPHQPPGAPVGSAVNTPGGFRLPFGIIPARRRRSVF